MNPSAIKLIIEGGNINIESSIQWEKNAERQYLNLSGNFESELQGGETNQRP
jgi:hypothetical protein